MRYKLTDNSIIQENHIVPFTVNWKTSLINISETDHITILNWEKL